MKYISRLLFLIRKKSLKGFCFFAFFYAFSLGRQYLCTAPHSRKSVLQPFTIAFRSVIEQTECIENNYTVFCSAKNYRNSSFLIPHSSLKKSRQCLLFFLIYSNSLIFAIASAMGTFTLTVLSRVAISITPPSIFLGLTIALTGTPKRSASENIKPAETGLSS